MFILAFLCLIELCSDHATERRAAASEEEEQVLPPHYPEQKAKHKKIHEAHQDQKCRYIHYSKQTKQNKTEHPLVYDGE